MRKSPKNPLQLLLGTFRTENPQLHGGTATAASEARRARRTDCAPDACCSSREAASVTGIASAGKERVGAALAGR